jgi:hypothetical protein
LVSGLEAAGAVLSGQIPIDISRDDAAHLAAVELAKPEYRAAQPSLLARIARWALDHLQSLLDRLSQVSPVGWWSLVAFVLLIAVVIALVWWRVGTPSRSRRQPQPLFVGMRRSAQDHRAAAEAFAADGAYDRAVRERFRAIVRSLEERAILDERPGRTADEAVRDAGVELPAYAGDLRAAARTFDGVAYGGYPAGHDQYASIATLDTRLTSARPALLAVAR